MSTDQSQGKKERSSGNILRFPGAGSQRASSVTNRDIQKTGSTAELESLLKEVAEATEITLDGDEVPCFSPEVIGRIGAMIRGRNYRDMNYQLAWLEHAAWRIGEPIFALCWEPSRGIGLLLKADILTNPSRQSLCLTREDGNEFIIRRSALRPIMAWYQLLVSLLSKTGTTGSFEQIDNMLSAMRKQPVSEKDVAETVKKLGKSFNEALEPYILPHQQTAKFRAIRDFMQEWVGPDFSLYDLNEEAMFQFWKTMNQPSLPDDSEKNEAPLLEFTKYETVVLDFHAFRQFFQDIQDQKSARPDQPDSIYVTADHEQDSWIRDVEDTVVIPYLMRAENCHVLLSSPPLDAIKLVTKDDLDLITRIEPFFDSAPDSARPVLRFLSIRETQNNLIQAERDYTAGKIGDNLYQERLLNPARHDYLFWQEQLQALASRLYVTARAVAGKLIAAEDSRFFPLLPVLMTPDELASFSEHYRQTHEDSAHQDSGDLAKNISFPSLTSIEDGESHQRLTELMTECKVAAKRIKRQGFHDPVDCDAFGEAAQVLSRLSEQLRTLNRQLAQTADWSQNYSDDQARFSVVFDCLYRERKKNG